MDSLHGAAPTQTASTPERGPASRWHRFTTHNVQISQRTAPNSTRSRFLRCVSICRIGTRTRSTTCAIALITLVWPMLGHHKGTASWHATIIMLSMRFSVQVEPSGFLVHLSQTTYHHVCTALAGCRVTAGSTCPSPGTRRSPPWRTCPPWHSPTSPSTRWSRWRRPRARQRMVGRTGSRSVDSGARAARTHSQM